jgi:formylglycine-generating enzyme required for sulfatase activity
MVIKQILFSALGVVAAVSARADDKVDFTKEVKPVLEMYCVACHSAKHAFENGELDLSTKAAAMAGGEKGKDIVPGKPEESRFIRLITLGADDKKLMPPKDKGGPLSKEQIAVLTKWVAQGANWPDDVKPLETVARPDAMKGGSKEAEMATIQELHKKIVANQKESSAKGMKPYTDIVPRPAPVAPVSFDLVAIPEGKFSMGSPDKEKGRRPDEGPQHEVKVDAFWMGKCEVTWDEYEMFMYPEERVKTADGTYVNDHSDAVAHPTKPYVEMSFGMGKIGYPAISMTQHAANKYCEWLSARTGHFYRLPTEAEWEYAARAGTKTAYFFGDDEAQLEEYAWFGKNSERGSDGANKYQKVGKKKPNPWGLYDMYGNVAEWCLDQYDPNFYKASANASNPWNKQTKAYPHVARGGSWDPDHYGTPVDLRSAARLYSDPSWKQQDPQLPKSIWYLTDAQFLGFRIVRPLKVPSPEEMYRYWNNEVEREEMSH